MDSITKVICKCGHLMIYHAHTSDEDGEHWGKCHDCVCPKFNEATTNYVHTRKPSNDQLLAVGFLADRILLDYHEMCIDLLGYAIAANLFSYLEQLSKQSLIAYKHEVL